MNADFELDRSVLAWIDEGPSSAPEALVASAFAAARQTRQSRAWSFLPWTDPMPARSIAILRQRRRVAVIVIAVVLILAALAMALGAHPPMRFPSGRLVFVGGAFDNVFVQQGPGAPRPVVLKPLNTKDGVYVFAPSLSRDGRVVAYRFVIHGDSSADDGVAFVAIDGSSLGSVMLGAWNKSDLAVPGWSLSWSPDGTRIAFSDESNTSQVRQIPALVIWNIGTPETRQLRLPDGVGGINPSWSPDGSLIAFTALADDHASIAVIGADGQNYRPVSNRSKLVSTGGGWIGGDVPRPAWSPDGKRITFAWAETDNNRDAPGRVSIIDLVTGSTRDLTTPSAYQPIWSPDGSHLAWLELTGAGRGRIVVAQADGSDARVLDEPPVATLPSLNLLWTPDSSAIAADMCAGDDFRMDCRALEILDPLGNAPGLLVDLSGGTSSPPCTGQGPVACRGQPDDPWIGEAFWGRQP